MSLDHIDTRTARYILDTAEAIDRRLTHESERLTTTDLHWLREDVAWLARQVAKLAEDAGASAADRKSTRRADAMEQMHRQRMNLTEWIRSL